VNDIDERMKALFKLIHGDIDNDGTGCYTEFVDDPNEYDEDQRPAAVIVMKNGYECWRATKSDLLFDYVTRGIEDQQ